MFRCSFRTPSSVYLVSNLSPSTSYLVHFHLIKRNKFPPRVLPGRVVILCPSFATVLVLVPDYRHRRLQSCLLNPNSVVAIFSFSFNYYYLVVCHVQKEKKKNLRNQFYRRRISTLCIFQNIYVLHGPCSLILQNLAYRKQKVGLQDSPKIITSNQVSCVQTGIVCAKYLPLGVKHTCLNSLTILWK